MQNPRLSALLLLLSITISTHQAAPSDRKRHTADVTSEASNDGWTVTVETQQTLITPTNHMTPLATPREKRSRVEKRKCNTATCVTQRLADFLVRSNNNHGPLHSPTNVGSFTYGKRDIVGLLRRESFDYRHH